MQRPGGRRFQPRPGSLHRLGVDAGGGHAGDPLRPQERDLSGNGGRRATGAADHVAVGPDHAHALPTPGSCARCSSPARSACSPMPTSSGGSRGWRSCRTARRASTRAAPARLPGERGDAARAVREAGAVELRHAGDPARPGVGAARAARRATGQPADPRPERPRPAAAGRGLLGPRQQRGVPRLARSRVRRRRQSGLPRADARLPALLLAGGRDHARPLRRPARGGVRTPRRRGEAAGSRSQRGAEPGLPRHAPGGLARLRSVPRLLQAGVLAAAGRVGAVRARHLQPRRDRPRRQAAALPLGLHRLQRQPPGAAGDGLQAVCAAAHDRRPGPELAVRRTRSAPVDHGQAEGSAPPAGGGARLAQLRRPSRRRAGGELHVPGRAGRGALRRDAIGARSGTR